MVAVPTFVWICAGLANQTAHEIGVHELRKQVVDLRVRYLRRLIEHYGLQEPDETIEVEIVDESAPPAPAEGVEPAPQSAMAA